MFDSVGGVAALDLARATLRTVERRVGVQHRDEVVTLTPAAPLPLIGLLPDGALPRGASVAVVGSASLLCWLLGATQADGWVVIAGWPELGAVALAEAGVNLERAVLVPDVGGRGAAVVAALVDGCECVVVGPGVQLVASERRRLLARARERGATLVSPLVWEGAALAMEVERVRWAGAERGERWLREAHLAVVRRSRADGAGRRFEVRRDRAGGVTVKHQSAAGVLAGDGRPIYLVSSGGSRGS